MNIYQRSNSKGPGRNYQKGLGLLDVVLAVVIFAVGMLALASLQGNLSRSSADANASTVAATLAEQILERLRSFEQIPAETGVVSYEGIVSRTETIAVENINYDVTVTVEDWYFMPDGETVTKNTGDLPSYVDTTISDFKRVELDISWDGTEFQKADGTATTGRLGSGAFSVTGIIPSVPVLGAAKIAADDDGDIGGPIVRYTPGQRPDVVPINLNNSKFKESSTPLPDVVVTDEIVETWFDVVTFNQSNQSSFIRREEFVVLSCECTLRLPNGSENGTGFMPTTWNGESYTEGEWVTKPYGESANSRQSKFCETCCRDHHDDPNNLAADFVYDPWRDWTSPAGAHKHYSPKKPSGFNEATKDGDDYLEACRMVRHDGFMRVAQDFRQEGLIATPQSFFLNTGNIGNYSSYVTDSVDDFYVSNATELGTPNFDMPGDSTQNEIALPTAMGLKSDQQVSRAIYIDHITAEAQATIDCVRGVDTDCVIPKGVDNYLEIFPFYEIQTTWLSYWNDRTDGDPIFITSQPVADNNTHSRGDAQLTGTAEEKVVAETYMHRGNVGLTSTDAIDGYYDAGTWGRDLHFTANPGGGGGVSPSYPDGVEGSLTSTVGINAAKVTLTGSAGVFCTSDATSFSCVLDTANTLNPTLTVAGYKSGNSDLWVCDGSGTILGTSTQDPKATVFDLSTVSGKMTGLMLVIQGSSC